MPFLWYSRIIPRTFRMKLNQTLRHSHDWAIDRIHSLCNNKEFDNAQAIQIEFYEWLNPDIDEHDIYSLEYIGD